MYVWWLVESFVALGMGVVLPLISVVAFPVCGWVVTGLCATSLGVRCVGSDL